jgi:fused signal recognition particle receptor
MERQQQEQK